MSKLRLTDEAFTGDESVKDAPLNTGTIPVDKRGNSVLEYSICCPKKMGILGPQGIFAQLRKDFSNFIQDGVVRVCSEPVPGAKGHTLSECIVYQSYLDVWGRGNRVFLYFDFCRSRVKVEGYAFKVMNYRKPKKWTLFGSHDCEHWEPIHRHIAPFSPGTNTYVEQEFDQTFQSYRYLMLKFYRKDVLIEKLDFYGLLQPVQTE